MPAKYLDVAALRSKTGKKFADVDVPEWDGTVKIRSLTSAEHLTAILMAADNRKMLHAAVVAIALVEPQLDGADAEFLQDMSAGVMQHLFTKIYGLSGLLDPKEQKELENQGNSKGSSAVLPAAA